MAKPRTTRYLIAAAASAAAAAATFELRSPNPSPMLPSSDDFKAGINSVVRSARAIYTIASNVVDYKCSLHGIPKKSEDYPRILSEVHLRSAKRILKLCEANKGFYVKAGQFAAAIRQVPKEYSSTLSSLQDQVIPCDFEVIKEVLIKNLGRELPDLFISIDEQAMAAASIAQVHRALLQDHQEVAVKVQYPGLEQQMQLDVAIMSFLSKSVAWFFPEYRFQWMVSEFAKAMTLELDFVQEGNNSERTAKNFRNNSIVRVPYVVWKLTTKQVLTMQFCRGHKVNDLQFLKEMGINPLKVAKALVEVFAAMIFVHGFIHGDPHPGNILVAPEGRGDFSLVLLDHGIYRQVNEAFRVDYCRLWQALIRLDASKIQLLGERLGAGRYSVYLPLIFMGRTINSKAGIGAQMSTEEKKRLKQELRSLKMDDLSSFMESLPPDFLTILRTDGLLRSLVSQLGASQQVRLLAYAKYALYGLSPKLDNESDAVLKVLFSRFQTKINYFQLRLVLEILELLSRMEELRCIIRERLKSLLVLAGDFMVTLWLPFQSFGLSCS